MHSRFASARRRGVAAVELAFLAPLLIGLLFGIWEVGRLLQVRKLVDNAAREGGRQASTGLKDTAQVTADVKNYLKNAGMPITNVSVTLQNLTNPSPPPFPIGPGNTSDPFKGAAQNDQIRISVSLPYGDVKWLASSFFVSPTLQITAVKDWTSINNKPLVVPPEPPTNLFN